MSVYQEKRTSLVIIGASVTWGHGLSHTQTYASLMQNRINEFQGNANKWAGWIPRNIHTDDVQPGGSAATAPFNGAPNVPGFGAGPTALNPVVVTSAFNGSVSDNGASKLNSFPTSSAPSQGNAGIFSNFGGYKTPAGGSAGAFTNPAVRLQSSVQNIRFAANYDGTLTAYLVIGLTGVGSVTLYTDWNGATGTTVTSTATPTMYTVNLGNPTTISPQSMSVYWASGTVDVTVLAPMVAQSVNQTTIHLCARNSYCLQDYNNATITSLIANSVVNPVSNGYSSPPIFIVGDMYNSMITGADQTAGDRRLSSLGGASSLYCTALAAIANNIRAALSGNCSIILTCPFEPGKPPLELYDACTVPNRPGNLSQTSFGSTGLAWLTDESISTYRTAISALASANGWGFVDQSGIPSLTTPGFFLPDGIHPSPLGAMMIAKCYIDALSL